MEEIWKDVVGYEGRYQVSNQARVRSLDRKFIANDGSLRKSKGVVLRKALSSSGYMNVILYKDGTKIGVTTGRLMALHFIPNPYNYTDINHINGNKLDDRMENLEWLSHANNMNHAIQTGLLKHAVGERASSAKLTWREVREIRALKGLRSGPSVGRSYNVSSQVIYSIWKGDIWKEST